MFCILEYTDYADYLRYCGGSGVSFKDVEVEKPPLSNQKLYFNPNCSIQLVLDFLLEKTNMTLCNYEYDVCDENGVMLGVKEYKSNVNSLVVFDPRNTYYFVAITRDDFGTTLTVTPILHPESETYKKIRTALKKRYFPTSRSKTKVTSSAQINLHKRSSGGSSRRNSTGH